MLYVGDINVGDLQYKFYKRINYFSFFVVIIMKNKKKEDIYYCFKFRCKRCPKSKECEKEATKKKSR